VTGQRYELRRESTLEIPKGDRSDYWAERVQENQGRIGLAFDFGDPRDFNGQTWVQQSGHDALIEFASNRINYRRTRAHIRSDDDRSGRLLIVCEGRMALTQNDDTVVLNPGEVGLYSTGREMSLAHDNDARALVLNIPESDPIASMLTEQTPLGLDPQRPMLGTAVAMVKSLVDHRETMTADDFTRINVHLRQVLAGALDDRQAPELSTLERLAQDVVTYIHLNSDDPTVTPDSIAAHFCCSLSQLHKALRTVRTTPARMLLDTRLERAKRRLQISTDTVTQVAFDSGFSAVSTFRDNFRSHNEQYPSEWRKNNSRSNARSAGQR
jgi:AraC-like DNA-binding protein